MCRCMVYCCCDVCCGCVCVLNCVLCGICCVMLHGVLYVACFVFVSHFYHVKYVLVSFGESLCDVVGHGLCACV